MEINEQNVPKPEKSQESASAEAMADRDMIREIYEISRKTKSYMMWQLYITLILVVLPLLASLIIVPFVMRSIASSYGSLLQ